ncbi:MFS transporter [Acinetobacter junii]|jgi:NNP family nitrate/nitrite transporter-like MFS transporter|uniref:MFS transporter n=1 Tax=Acinetobacter junii TaxID=40215 RepID=A0ABU8ZIY5_ACIJU|nr:MFS transporter [Acinetobacter junii]MDH0668511.1 MFS transporter [Acinetobacter junii]MDH1375994.1 MFS transporter [Acinetobacter junii]QQV66721.1 Transporter, major facilitator family protein [Acinetobacter junii]QXR09826.1 MFS transporter [Acinetobacter junii]USR74390.1 MFS transporter [Acinetobacter junii]
MSSNMNLDAKKATEIKLFSFSTPAMRAFHMTWLAFFVCFFAWFACAPLMPVIKGEFNLTKDQIANINIAAVAITILIRLIVGPLCDKYGPRKTYTALLILGSIPVFGVAAANTYESFLFFRLLIGAIGASFVITQYHTSVMFAPNVVGTANAASAGWGNAGGGATQAIMPLILGAIVMFGVEQAMGWRIALLVPGIMMVIVGVLYWKLTQDCPQGDFKELRANGVEVGSGKKGGMAILMQAARNYRVWILFVSYAACFGIEIFIHNIAAMYYVDRFNMGLKEAGLTAGIFGLLALFARALGGIVSDKVALTKGLDGRTKVLFILILLEGLFLILFSQMNTIGLAIITMTVFALFTHMSCGATYALVPFIDRNALGGVAGIIGAGGNVGAVAAGFLLKGLLDVQTCLMILGCLVTVAAFTVVLIRFSVEHKDKEKELYEQALLERNLTT